MKKKLTLLGIGLILLALRRGRQAPTQTDGSSPPKDKDGGYLRDKEGRLVVPTPWGYISLEPGESVGDPSVFERARREAEAREVNRFYEAIAQEREKRIPPGSRLKRDRWGFLYEKNPNGLGWREFGSDPDEPYQLKANGSW